MQFADQHTPREALDGLGPSALRFVAPDPNKLLSTEIGTVDPGLVIRAEISVSTA